MAGEEGKHDLGAILCSSNRDFFVRNNGDQVKLDSLNGKLIGLYFSASWCGPCHRFTPKLVEVYNELIPVGKFEIVFVSSDNDEESFNGYFSGMPWLAIPFSESDLREQLNELFSVEGIPHLVILNENGELLSNDGVEIVEEYGAEGYPFTSQHVEQLKEKEEEAKRNQSLDSLLASRNRDYVIMADGTKVNIAELEGKTVGLYFMLVKVRECAAFTSKLVEMFRTLNEERKVFEVVVIPLDKDEQRFQEEFKNLPWFSLPVNDQRCNKLARYFDLSRLPTLVIIGPDGKTLHSNVAEAIEEHGVNAYPFTPEKFIELEEIEKAKKEAQTLESILVSKDSNFVIGKAGDKILVSTLVGKTVLLYFSAHWCPPCRAFLPVLLESYQKINAKSHTLEVVFISSDRDQTSFDNYFSEMPWSALPFGDERKDSLSRLFKVRGIPKLVAIGPDGKTVTTDARELIMSHGADAYPFTSEQLKVIKERLDKMAEDWPKTVNHKAHKHELLLTKRQKFMCDVCDESGQIWSYYCEECDFDLHPKCAGVEGEEEGKPIDEENVTKDGWKCDGDKCVKA